LFVLFFYTLGVGVPISINSEYISGNDVTGLKGKLNSGNNHGKGMLNSVGMAHFFSPFPMKVVAPMIARQPLAVYTLTPGISSSCATNGK
jgi:hypothetical protein